MNRKRVFRRTGTGRRILSFLFAFVWLFSASGISTYAEDTIIYSEPVTAPIRVIGTPQPEEAEVEPLGLPEAGENPEEYGTLPEEEEGQKEDGQPGDEPLADETSELPEENAIEAGNEYPGEMIETEESAGDLQVNIPEENPEEQTEEIAEDIGTEAEAATEPEPERIWYAGSLTAETEGCIVRIDYPAEACIDESASLSLGTAKGAELYTALKSAAKVIRNEENETWNQQVSEDGNLFYVLKMTDAEGNEILPAAGMNLICEKTNSPEGVTYFLTGSNARILEEQDGVLSVSDYRMEPFGYATVDRIQIGTMTQEYQAADYQVTAAYGPEAEFPSDTEMKVREIMPGTPEYALYSGMTEETLGEEWREITLERYFDITFVSGGKEVEPQADVDVQIIFNDVIELTEEQDVQAVHIENNEAKVIESETDSNEDAAKQSGGVIDTVSFTSDSFSVFGVVQRTKITQKVLTADGNTYEISVTYSQDAAIPEDAELVVTELQTDDELYAEYLQKAVRAALKQSDQEMPGEDEGVYIAEDQYGRFFDIEIRSGGQKIEPEGSVSVKISLADAPEDRLNVLQVIHFAVEEPDILDAEVDAEICIWFETDSFSVYGVITEPNGQPTSNLDGKAVRINVSNNNGYYYLTNEQIVSTNNQPAKLRHSQSADDAALWQFEAAGGNNQYYIFTYINGTKKYMNISYYNRTDRNLYLSDSPQALTVSRRNDGKYVIYTNINGNNCYVDLWAGGTSEGFAAYAASNPNANQQLTFDFSTPAGQQYAVIVHYNDAYYVVEEDGTLTRVNYDPEAKAVEMDNPVLWNYQAGERNLLSSVTDGRTFGGPGGTADFFYYKYIDAAADNGIFTEDSSHPDGKDESGFVFENNRMRSTSNTSKYLGVEVDSSGIPVRISGNANFGDAVEVLLAKIIDTFVPSDKPANNTVNHLDISIHGNALLNYPLPRGTYYDANGNELYTITRDNPKTITMQESVPVTRDDIISAEIVAKDKNGNALDNAFYVTGYTGNEGDQNPDLPTQIRIEGSFRVSDHVSTSYPNMNGDEDANWSWLKNDRDHIAIRADRLENEITYYVKTTKQVTFTLKDGDQILYDAERNPITVEVPVTMAGNCSYWSGKNTCPGIIFNGGRDQDGPWANGCIVGSGADATGIDFVLGGSTTQAENSYPTIDITKYVVDENNQLLMTTTSFQNAFTVYLIENTALSSEYSTDLSAYSKETELMVQVGSGVGKNYYDLNVPGAMVYIEEDKSTIPQTIKVKGNEWEYVKTVIETEYVRRWPQSDNHTEPNHRTGDLTVEAEHYNSIPELAGKFKVGNDNYDNTILNFYVYNVYESKTDVTVTKEWTDDAAHYGNDSVEVRLIRYKKDAPPIEMGILNITHVAEGLPELPPGFAVTYSYSGEGGFASGLSAGSYDVPAGNYTVTARVSNSAAPEGYIYEYTTDPITVRVPENGTGTATFKSIYTEEIPEMGELNITHISSGLPYTYLPDGFAVTYSYSGAGKTEEGLSAGKYEVPAGDYTVTAYVTRPVAPSGYDYVSTSGSVNVTVPANGSAQADFVSTYKVQDSGSTWKIIQYYNGQQYYSGNISYPVGTRVTVTIYFTNGWWNREFEAKYGSENLTYRRESVYIGNDYVNRYRVTFTVKKDTELVIRANISNDSPVYSNNRYFTIESNSAELKNSVRYIASAGVSSGRMRSSAEGRTRAAVNVPEDYGLDPEWEQTVTLTSAEEWSKIVKDIPVYDEYGQPYYYAVREVEVPQGYEVSYEPADPVSAEELENTELKVINSYLVPVTGTLIVHKLVNGNAADLSKSFTFTVLAKDAEGQAIPDGYYGEMRFENGISVFSLRNNGSKTAEGLPDGTMIEVGENADGYESSREGEDGPVAAGETKEITFTNTRNTYGDLQISKEVTGEGIDESREFTFTITLDGHTGEETYDTYLNCANQQIPGAITFTDGTAIVKLKHHETLTIRNLPNETRYEVTEENCSPDYYAPSVTGETSGWITGGTGVPSAVSYTNPKAPVVDILAKKNWGNEGNSFGATAVQFTLSRRVGSDNPEIVGTAILTDGQWSKTWNELRKYKDDEETKEYIYIVEETGVYFGEISDGQVNDEDWVEPYMYDNVGGQVTFDDQGHGSAIITNTPATVDVIVEKTWMPILTDPAYSWEAKFNLKSDKSGNEILNDITISNTSNSAQRTFSNLPQYVKVDQEFQTITYTAQETDFTLWYNGEVVATMDGEEYLTGDPDTVTDEYGNQVISLVNSKNTARFTVYKKWVDVENPDNMPEVHFTLKYYRVGVDMPQNGQSYVFKDETGEWYDNLPLGPQNNWTWECPVELPDNDGHGHTYAYFIEENKDNMGKVAFDKKSIPPGMQNSRFIEEDSYISSQGHRTDQTQQISNPEKAYIEGGAGSITVSNRAPGGYMQMDIKKKFLAYREDGSLATVTGDDNYTRDLVIEIQIYRRAVNDAQVSVSNYSTNDDIIEIEPWEPYGKRIRVGYDSYGRAIADNGGNTFEIENAGGSWHWVVEGSNHLRGLPRYGFHFNEDNGEYESVKYQYVYIETGAYKDIQGTPLDDGYDWSAIPPAVWEAGGQIIMFPQRIAQDQDRLMNLMSTDLQITKEWIGAPQADKVYLKIYRLDDNNYNTSQIQDYTNVINEPLVSWEGGSLNEIPDDGDSTAVEKVNGRKYLVLSAENNWTDTIRGVRTSGQNQAYRYWIQEMGYHDAYGDHWTEDEIEEFDPEYSIVSGTEQVYLNKRDGGPAIVLGPKGSNHLKVTNTSQYGALEIIKNVPDESEDAAEGAHFRFNVTLTLPEGISLSREELSALGGNIVDFSTSGNTASFTIVIEGKGKATVNGIPFGSAYTVSEINVPVGWEQDGELEYSDENKTVTKDETVFDTVTVTNVEVTTASVEKVWKKNGKTTDWPDEIRAVTVQLYQYVANESPEPVYNTDGTLKTLTFEKNAELEERTFTELPKYDAQGQCITYTFKEVSITTIDPELMYLINDEQTIVVTGIYENAWTVETHEPDENGKTTIINRSTEIRLLKVDAQSGVPLAGAEFRLRKITNSNNYEEFKPQIITGEDGPDKGSAIITGLTDGTYELSEIKVPAGYLSLGMPITFTVEDGVPAFVNTDYVHFASDSATFTVRNVPGLPLPSTGGSGTQVYTVGGLAMALFAGLLLLNRRRKKLQ